VVNSDFSCQQLRQVISRITSCGHIKAEAVMTFKGVNALKQTISFSRLLPEVASHLLDKLSTLEVKYLI